MIDNFFILTFIANIVLFIVNLGMVFFYEPQQDNRGMVKSWKIYGLILVFSILMIALFYVAFFNSIIPTQVVLTSSSGLTYTSSVMPTDASMSVVMLQVVNVIFALNSLFCIIGWLKGFKIFRIKRFKR